MYCNIIRVFHFYVQLQVVYYDKQPPFGPHHQTLPLHNFLGLLKNCPKLHRYSNTKSSLPVGLIIWTYIVIFDLRLYGIIG